MQIPQHCGELCVNWNRLSNNVVLCKYSASICGDNRTSVNLQNCLLLCSRLV
jgi:hypothetical protein